MAPKKCRLGRFTSRAGNEYTGIGPRGCKIQTDKVLDNSVPLQKRTFGPQGREGEGATFKDSEFDQDIQNVMRGTAADSMDNWLAPGSMPPQNTSDRIPVAKQRIAQNPVNLGTARPVPVPVRADENRVFRRARVFYKSPLEQQGVIDAVQIDDMLLDTGANVCVYLNFEDFKLFFPYPINGNLTRWEYTLRNLPYNARTEDVQGIGGTAKTFVIPPTPNLIVMVEVFVGRKGQQVAEWRGGQCHVTFGQGGGGGVVGQPFIRAHSIMVK